MDSFNTKLLSRVEWVFIVELRRRSSRADSQRKDTASAISQASKIVVLSFPSLSWLWHKYEAFARDVARSDAAVPYFVKSAFTHIVFE